jgi:hypothetical protein
VWGDAIYTIDSDVSTAAVHAGVVNVGETKTVKLWVVPSPGGFAAASRNGVRSGHWGPFHAAFFLQPAASSHLSAARRVQIPLRVNVVGNLAVGESRTMSITGSDKGWVWGTDEYTGDSSLEAAAVHAGALKAGEPGEVIVTRVPSRTRYAGSTRHGVQSRSWGGYPTAFTVERKTSDGR